MYIAIKIEQMKWLLALSILVGLHTTVSAQENEIDENTVYTIVEVMPIYPGGDQALVNWVGRTVEYPKKAKAAAIAGVVYVSFVINKKGKTTQVKVVRGSHPMLDKAAVKCIKKLKGYKAGTQSGKPVNVQFTIPIRFALS